MSGSVGHDPSSVQSIARIFTIGAMNIDAMR
jgi:hypothetical protein